MARRSSTRRQLWAWSLRHPRLSAPLAGLIVLLVIIGAVSGGDHHTKAAADPGLPTTPAHTAGATSGSIPESASPTKAAGRASLTAAPADRQQASSQRAAAVLAVVRVKGRAANTGYTRNRFGPAWTDDNDDPAGHNGCDTRNDILRRDLTTVALKPGSHGCTVLTGTLHDPYTGRTISFVRGRQTSSAVQIDHVVALDDAWQTGAQQWSLRKRTDLANDPLNLLAVDGATNEAKGDGDAATWLPPNKPYRCAYVARQVAVKARYGLWMTSAEHDAIAHILSRCPGQKAPTEAGSPPAGRAATSHASAPPTRHAPTTPRTHSSTVPAQAGIVHPGAFCSPAGARGVTNRGTPMVCGPASDGRNRWHHA